MIINIFFHGILRSEIAILLFLNAMSRIKLEINLVVSIRSDFNKEDTLLHAITQHQTERGAALPVPSVEDKAPKLADRVLMMCHQLSGLDLRMELLGMKQ